MKLCKQLLYLELSILYLSFTVLLFDFSCLYKNCDFAQAGKSCAKVRRTPEVGRNIYNGVEKTKQWEVWSHKAKLTSMRYRRS